MGVCVWTAQNTRMNMSTKSKERAHLSYLAQAAITLSNVSVSHNTRLAHVSPLSGSRLTHDLCVKKDE
ncbi:unnamed protein product [Ectocarpus sp. 6 AP-2014]